MLNHPYQTQINPETNLLLLLGKICARQNFKATERLEGKSTTKARIISLHVNMNSQPAQTWCKPNWDLSKQNAWCKPNWDL